MRLPLQLKWKAHNACYACISFKLSFVAPNERMKQHADFLVLCPRRSLPSAPSRKSRQTHITLHCVIIFIMPKPVTCAQFSPRCEIRNILSLDAFMPKLDARFGWPGACRKAQSKEVTNMHATIKIVKREAKLAIALTLIHIHLLPHVYLSFINLRWSDFAMICCELRKPESI